MARHDSAAFRAAIDELRPELAERDHLRVAFMQIRDDETYFSTIAKDIYNIILDMIQPLRKSYINMDHSAIIQSMQLFLNKYMCSGWHSKYSYKSVIRLDQEKLKQDFPDKFLPEQDYYVVSAKMVHGQLYIHPWPTSTTISQAEIYLGEQFPKNSNIPNSTATLISKRKDITEKFQAMPIFIMPCGLIGFDCSGPTLDGAMHIFLFDPCTMSRSTSFYTKCHTRYSYVDDSGNINILEEYGDEILRFGPHGPEMMLFGVE